MSAPILELEPSLPESADGTKELVLSVEPGKPVTSETSSTTTATTEVTSSPPTSLTGRTGGSKLLLWDRNIEEKPQENGGAQTNASKIGSGTPGPAPAYGHCKQFVLINPRKKEPSAPPALTKVNDGGGSNTFKIPERSTWWEILFLRDVETPDQSEADDQDPIVREYGPLIRVEDDEVSINHIAVAAKFMSVYEIRFDAEFEMFRRYNPSTGIWETLKEAEARLALGAFLKNLADQLNAPGLLYKRTSSLLSAILKLAKGIAVMERALSDAIPRVHVANGVVEITPEGPNLRRFRPDDWARHSCKIPYNPKAKCDRFLEQFLKPALSAEDIRLLQRFFGAVLLGLNAAQRFLVLYGDAAHGKSTLVKILEWIIGLERVATLRTNHLAGRFEMHAFQGKTLLTAKDVPTDFLAVRGASAIKALIGDDVFETEQKYGGRQQLDGERNLFVTSNAELPLSVDGDEGAWRRRLLVLNFKRTTVAQRVSNFAEVLLKEEGEGILAWIIQGAVEHLKELKSCGDYELTQGQRDRIESWILRSRSVEEFLDKSVIACAKASVTVEELHSAYVAFCKERDWQAVSPKTFQTKLPYLMSTSHGVYRRNDIVRVGKSVRGFKGVQLKTS